MAQTVSVLKSTDPELMAAIAALLAIDLARGLDLEEQNIFGNFIVAVGSIILTIASINEARTKQAEAKAAKTGEGEAAKAGEPKKPAPAGEQEKPEQPQPGTAKEGKPNEAEEWEEIRRQLRELRALVLGKH